MQERFEREKEQIQMKPVIIVVVVCVVAGILLKIFNKVFSSISALSALKSLRNGKTAKLSIAQIAALNVNLPDAKRVLTAEEFARVYALYALYQKERSKMKLTPEEYAFQAAKIVVSFDKVAPFTKYSGEQNPIDAEIRLSTSYDIVKAKMPAIPKERFQEQETNMGKFVVDTETGEVVKESNTTCDHHEPASQPVSPVLEESPRKCAIFTPAICILSCACVALSACSLWLWNETQHLNAEVETLSEKNSDLEARVSDISQKIAKRDIECQKLQNEKTELESTVESRSTRILELVTRLDQIGYVVEGSKYYHRFEIDSHSWDGPYYGLNHLKCIEFPDDAKYLAHNVELCKYLGYSPCPTCW